MNSEWSTSPWEFFLNSLSQSGVRPNWHRLPRLLSVSLNMQRAVTLLKGIWFFVSRLCHNACAAAFERYRIAGCEGVFMKGYTVGGIEKQKEIPKNMADKLL